MIITILLCYLIPGLALYWYNHDGYENEEDQRSLAVLLITVTTWPFLIVDSFIYTVKEFKRRK